MGASQPCAGCLDGGISYAVIYGYVSYRRVVAQMLNRVGEELTGLTATA